MKKPQFKKGDKVWRDVPALVGPGLTWGVRPDGPLTVMGQVDNYLVVRHPRAHPFCLPANKARSEP